VHDLPLSDLEDVQVSRTVPPSQLLIDDIWPYDQPTHHSNCRVVPERIHREIVPKLSLPRVPSGTGGSAFGLPRPRRPHGALHWPVRSARTNCRWAGAHVYRPDRSL